MPTIQNLSYKKVIVPGDYTINPIDDFGNAFKTITIDCDATAGDINLYLSAINVFNGVYDCVITINRIDASQNGVNIFADSTANDLIGSQKNIGLPSLYDSAVLKPASLNGWSVILSISTLPIIVDSANQSTFATDVYIDYPVGTTICIKDYDTSTYGCTVVKTTNGASDYSDWNVIATDNKMSTNGIGDNPK